MALVVVAVLAALVGLVFTRHGGGLLRLDQRIDVAATDVTRAHPSFKRALLVWQGMFHPLVVYLVAAPVVVLTWRRGLPDRALWGAVTMLLAWNLAFDVKLVVARPRPVIPDPVSHAPGYSFPSGHAINVTMMTTTCLVMAWPLLVSRTARAAALTAAVVAVVGTVLDRIFLGVHFPSDVTAGGLLALALTAASWRAFASGRREIPVVHP